MHLFLKGSKRSNPCAPIPKCVRKQSQSQTSHFLLNTWKIPANLQPRQNYSKYYACLIDSRIYFLILFFFFLLLLAHMRKLLRTPSPLRSPLEEAQKLHLLPKGESNHCGRSESVPSSRRTAVFQPGPCVPCARSPHISQPYYLVGTGEGVRHHFKIAAYTQ